MVRLMHALAAAAMVLAGAVVAAGEIIISYPAPSSATGDRNEVEAQRHSEEARRRRTGEAAPTGGYALEESGDLVAPEELDESERLRRSARGYVSGDEVDGEAELRTAPLSEAERMRLRARRSLDYGQPAPLPKRKCGYADNQIGMIGEGHGAQQSQNVIEKGGQAVAPGCR